MKEKNVEYYSNMNCFVKFSLYGIRVDLHVRMDGLENLFSKKHFHFIFQIQQIFTFYKQIIKIHW